MEESIRFIDSHYHTLFIIPEGGKIVVDSTDLSGNPCEYVRTVHILDALHIELKDPNGRSSVYHIYEFAERMEALGNRYRPYEGVV